MPRVKAPVAVGLVAAFASALFLAGGVAAQTIIQPGIVFPAPVGAPAVAPAPAAVTAPPPGPALAPALPRSDVPPPGTDIAATRAANAWLGDVQLIAVVWNYLGDSSVVFELVPPVLHPADTEVGIFSGPNATDSETANGVYFGTKPAGTEAIYFFIRGTRGFSFDVAFGDYAWFDLNQ